MTGVWVVDHYIKFWFQLFSGHHEARKSTIPNRLVIPACKTQLINECQGEYQS